MKRFLALLVLAVSMLFLGTGSHDAQGGSTSAQQKRNKQAAPSAKTNKPAAKAQPGKTKTGGQARHDGRSRPKATIPARKPAPTPAQAAARPDPQAKGAAGGDADPSTTAPRYNSVPAASPRPAKPIANRTYAIGGDSFFHNGKKIRVSGIDTPEWGQANSDLAKQRLQTLLDSGQVTVEPVATDDSGYTVGVVRVNGRDVADQLRAQALENPKP